MRGGRWVKKSKPWGWEDWLVVNEHYALKTIYIRKGHRLSLQYHKKKTETLMLNAQAGRDYALVTVNGRTWKLGKTRQQITIYPGQIHRIAAPAGWDCSLTEISTPELDDVVRIADDYGR